MVTVVEPDADELAGIGDRRQQLRASDFQPHIRPCVLDNGARQVQELVTAAQKLQHVRRQSWVGGVQVDHLGHRRVGRALDPARPDLSMAGEADQLHPVLLVVALRPWSIITSRPWRPRSPGAAAAEPMRHQACPGPWRP
jgi:hypothetical protein